MSSLKTLLWPHKEKLSYINKIFILFWSLILIGLLSLIFPAWVKYYEDGWHSALIAIGSGLFLAGASTLFGSVIGFLFGVPKYRKNDDPKIALISGSYQPNTNLEQISDWLTKIIVGVGLVELKNIVSFLHNVGKFCGPVFGPTPSGEIVAIGITVHYTIVGFIQGFLLAYLWLPRAFNKSETSGDKQPQQS
jgi:hypothetical protein